MSIEKMKEYYIEGYWTIERLQSLLKNKKITQEQYDEIIASKPAE